MITFREWLREAKESTEYKEYFKKILTKYNVEDPSELSKEDKQKFFDEVDAGWKGEKEEPEAGDVNEAKNPKNSEDAIKILSDIINRDKIQAAYKQDLKVVIDFLRDLK